MAANEAHAATYYLDAVNGDDANPGTTDQPWQTLARAYTWYSGDGSKVQEGDTVIVRNGDYGTFTESGLSADRTNWITYSAAGGHSPNLSRISVTWDNYKNSYLRWEGFNVKNGIVFQRGSYFYVYDCNITCEDEGIDGYYAPYFAGTDIAISGRYDVNHVTVEGCDIWNASRGIRCGDDRGAYWTIKDNTIHRLVEDGIKPDGSSHLVIEGNVVYDMVKGRGGFGLVGTISGSFVVGETVVQAGSGAEGVVESVVSSTKLAVYTTTETLFTTAAAGGGTVTGQTSLATLSTVSNCDYSHSDPIQVESGAVVDDIVIRGNTFIATGSGLAYLRFYGNGTNVTIENNLAYGDSANAFEVGGVSSGLKIYNNTFRSGLKLATGYSASGSNLPSIIDELYNNIISNYSQSADVSESLYMRVVSHGNNIFGSSPNGQGGPTYPFALNSTEAVTSSLNALFTNAAGNDYTLAAGSAAIDFGNADYGPATDKNGNARVNEPDAGCYEYTASQSENQAPVLQSIGAKSVSENAPLIFTISATDADGDTITYSASGLPTGATFSSGSFNWTPGYTQAGSYDVTFTASDGTDTDSEVVTITVGNTNRAPVLASIGAKSVSENALLTFTVSAADADGDTITYSASSLPTGATFSSGSFSWTPGYTQTGSYDVTFTASDGTDSDSEVVTITVGNVNRAPVLGAIGNQSIDEGSLLSFSLSATDTDGDSITYSAAGLPAGAAFAGQTFTWTPGYTQAGAHQVTFTASDGAAGDSETVAVTVNNTNRAPVLDAIADRSVNEADLLSFTVSATDADGDTLGYSASSLPSGASFAEQSFSWTPSHSQTDNSYEITFTVSDGELEDSQAVGIVVSDTSAPSVAGRSPEADSIQAPLNSLVTLHVTDDGKGVDPVAVTITLDGSVIYTGDTANYLSATGNCRRTGTAADYAYAYQPNAAFDFDETKTVTVNATDLGGNAMTQVSYSFRTEMRSFGSNTILGSDVEGVDKGAPATAADGNGNIWAVWHAGAGGSRDIYIARLAAGTSSFGAGAQITTDTADQHNPALALGADDKLYVVWQDNRNGDWDVYGSTSTNGTTWSAQRRITDSNDNQINPAIAIDGQSTNHAYVVWQDDRSGNQDIYVAVSANAFLTNVVTRITSDTSDQTGPAIAIDSSDTAYVVWTDARNATTDIYGASSVAWTNVPVVNKAANQSNPAIAVESTGSILHFAWVDEATGNSDIYYASTDGLPSSPLTGSNLIDDDSGADQLAPMIAVAGGSDDNLHVFVSWQDSRNTDTDLYMARADAANKTNVLVGDGRSNSAQSEPAIGLDQYDQPYLVWTDGRSANDEIYYAASTFMQPSALTSQVVTSASGGTVGTDPNAITAADDVSVVVPGGACAYDVTISITKIENPPAFSVLRLSSYDFGPSGIEFSQPVTITIPYAVSDSDNTPTAYWYDSLTGALSQQGITNVQIVVLSPTMHALRFKTTHFTPFYVAAAAAAAGGGGGGGGGCEMSPCGGGSIVEFLVPYIALAAMMTIIKRRDAKNRKAANIVKGKLKWLK